MLTRLALHAGLLGFAHPLSREKVEVVSPLPREYEVALKNLRKFARPARKAG
jgi:23S rRNA pseudouridine1911/1915/1917 synthase